jgi:hypothetical protein
MAMDVPNPYENLEAMYHLAGMYHFAEVGWVRACQQRFRSVRFVRYGVQESAAAPESLLFGAVGDIDQRIPDDWAVRR